MDAVERATAALESNSPASTGYLSPTEPWTIAMIEPPLRQLKLPPLPLLDVPSSPHVSLSTLEAAARAEHDEAYRNLLRQQRVQPQPSSMTERRHRVMTTPPTSDLASSSHASPAPSEIEDEAQPLTKKPHIATSPVELSPLGFKGRWHCQRCKHNFASKEALETHYKSTYHLKPHPCEACGKRFARRSHLRVHEKIHLGLKDQICPVCKRGFVQASNLRAHMRIHSGERPYSCHLCPKTFSVSSSLKAHLKSHQRRNETTTTECPKCGHVLPDHDTFKFHLTQCAAYHTDVTDLTDDSDHLHSQPHLLAPPTPTTSNGSSNLGPTVADPSGRSSNSPGERSGGDPASPAQTKQAVHARMHTTQPPQPHGYGHSGLGKVTGIHDDELMAVAASLLDSVNGDIDQWASSMPNPLASVLF
eukprot:m.77642 g.77642  ORF g.77642 m.77642 type:complete len:418 (-) comp14478_c0_seq1:1040-2293(-)